MPSGALDCTSTIYCYSNSYTCDELSPYLSPLRIQLQENYYTLPPAAYTFPRGNIFQKLCTVAISYTDSSGGVYILGDTFLRNFVTTFDYAKGSINLTTNVNAPQGIVIEYKMSGWKIFGIIVLCLASVCLIIWLVVCCCKRHRKSKVMKAYMTLNACEQDDADITPDNKKKTKYFVDSGSVTANTSSPSNKNTSLT